MRKSIDIKGKVSLYYNQITIGLQSITISDIIIYILEAHSTSSSLKKKKNFRRQKEQKKEAKSGKEEKKKGMERLCTEGKGNGRIRCGRKDEKEGEGEGEEEEKEKQKMEKAIHERHRLLQTYSLA